MDGFETLKLEGMRNEYFGKVDETMELLVLCMLPSQWALYGKDRCLVWLRPLYVDLLLLEGLLKCQKCIPASFCICSRSSCSVMVTAKMDDEVQSW